MFQKDLLFQGRSWNGTGSGGGQARKSVLKVIAESGWKRLSCYNKRHQWRLRRDSVDSMVKKINVSCRSTGSVG